ncbi:FAD dependent oxidoreductase [Xylariaceae sp. FL0255]|nr:FAD dependent oxidoreductase [Xylariaceae sp. FL0255]
MPSHNPLLKKDSRILIVGSGVFGLSTALWLARSGYTAVTVFDMQDTGAAGYDPGRGIDSASADINKIIRFSYGPEIEYQRLATRAAEIWEEWNREWAEEEQGKGKEKLWNQCGFLRMGATDQMPEFELETLRNMELEGIRDRQFRSDDEGDVQRATQEGWAHKLDPCRRQEKFGVHKAVLDSTAGFVVAYKSCAWAQSLARKAGVEFVLHPVQGKVVAVESAAESSSSSERPSVRTADGKVHEGDLVIVAGGGWTAGLLPEASGLIETTAGSVAMIHIPQDRLDLWERFSPENFPVVSWGFYEGKDCYSFPRDENGVIKIGWRHTKFTNYRDVTGGSGDGDDNGNRKRISVPKTAHVTEEKETRIPKVALDAIKEYISVNLPELEKIGISATKLCWYTDSLDNSFVVDFVPGRPGVVICTGGSGHGFKFLPILGQEVVKILEGKGEQTVYGKMWKWRGAASGAVGKNGLEEGEEGPRVLDGLVMADERDWVF